MRTIIAGPPGTGKTHTLVNTYLRKELFLQRTDPKKICYITFSNAAAKEARERIQKEYPNKEIEWISTMHSMGTKMLGIDTTTQLLKDKNWNAFKNKYGHNDMHFETIEKENGYHEYKNQYMKIIEYSRCRKIKLQDAAIELDLIDYIREPLLIQINQDIIDYKKDYNMYEFSDMISEFVEKSKCPSLDAVFLDEAQEPREGYITLGKNPIELEVSNKPLVAFKTKTEIKDLPSLSHDKMLILPCLAQAALGEGNPTHKARFHLVSYLAARLRWFFPPESVDDATKEEHIEKIVDFCSIQGWVDFDREITHTQVSSIVKGKYSLSTCKTLIDEGFCSGLCMYYDNSAGDLL